MATDRERRLRRAMTLSPALMLGVCFAALWLITRGASIVLGIALLATIYPFIWSLLIVAQRLSNAHMDGRQHVRAVGYRVCTRCEYDLSATETDPVRCPECGTSHALAELRSDWEDVYDRLENQPTG